jgi:hypothetical protein
MPKNDINSLVLVGVGQFNTACFLTGAMDIPSALTNFPKKLYFKLE